MQQRFNFLFNPKFSLSLGVSGIALFLLSLYNRIMHIDDAWLGEYAYWNFKIGHVKSELFRGFEGYENQIYVCHKFFLMQGSWLIQHFGFDLYVLKSLSLIYIIALLPFIYLYLKENVSKKLRTSYFLIFIALLFTNPIFFEYGFVFRPEINVMTLGFISFFLIDIGLNKKNILLICISGIISGISVLTHLNSIIFILSGLVIILLERKYFYFLIYGLISACISLFYFMDIHSSIDYNQMVHQFINDPALNKEKFIWYTYILNILKEHERFFHSPKEIFFSVILFLVISLNFRFIWNQHRRIFLYSISLVLMLAIIAHGKTSKYSLIYLPFLCLLIVIGLGQQILMQYKLNWVFPFIFIYFMGSSVLNVQMLSWKKKSDSSHNAMLAKNIPLGSKVLAPMQFVFNELNNYQIQGLHCYRFFEKRKQFGNTPFNVFKVAEYFSNEYIIFDEEYIQHYNLTSGKIYGSYKPISIGKEWIYKKFK